MFPSVGGCCRHAPGALDLIDVPIEYDHLAVEVGEVVVEAGMLRRGIVMLVSCC